MKKHLFVLICFFTFIIVSQSRAQEWLEITKALPVPYDNYHTYNFGSSICVDGDYAIVGAYKYKDFKGCAFILHYNGTDWETQAKLTFSDKTEWFGYSVSILGDVAVVGAPYDKGEIEGEYRYRIGAAYVYEKPAMGWQDMTETAKLVASDGESDDLFGNSVTIESDYIAIGVPNDDKNGWNSGSVYVFEKPFDGWQDTTETAILKASDGESESSFGFSIDSYMDHIVIGAYNHNDTGAVYVFQKPIGGWKDTTETASLFASDINRGDFGCFVSISENLIVAGAAHANGVVNNSGAAYLYKKPSTGWTNMSETAKLISSDGLNNDNFGNAGDVSGNTVIIGASYDDILATYNNEGSVYIFEMPATDWSNMTETAKFTASNASVSGGFGRVVSISGDNILIDEQKGIFDNGIYYFKKPATGWINGSEDFTVLPNDPNTDDDNYGFSVSIDGNYAVVGATHYHNKTGCAYVLHFNGREWITLGRLTASDGDYYDELGYSVSISANEIVIGSINAKNKFGERGGAAYIFSKPVDGWHDMNETAKIVSNDGRSNDAYGASVDISNDQVVVGAPGHYYYNQYSGSVYVYTKPVIGWKDTTETARLITTDINDGIGGTVSISGNLIITGAVDDDDNGARSGSAYLFERPAGGWVDTTQTAELLPSDGKSSAYFGKSVSCFENCVVVGANGLSESVGNGIYIGSAYVFEKPNSGWKDTTEIAKLIPSTHVFEENFGSSVDISENRIVIGTNPYNYHNVKIGSVYIYLKENGKKWISGTESVKINSPNGVTDDKFGTAISLSHDNLLVGAYMDDFSTNENSGSVFFYKQDKLVKVKDKVCEGDEAILAVVNYDEGSTIQWQENKGVLWQNLDGENNDTLIIPNVNIEMNGVRYRGIISGTLTDTTGVATLTVYENYLITETVFACTGDSYTFPDGNVVENLASPIVYNSYLQSITGCDSIIETTVQLNPIYNSSEVISINFGESYTFPDGTSQDNIMESVTYNSYLQTYLGCDSIIETTLNIQNDYHYYVDTVGVCYGSDFTFIDGTTDTNITSEIYHEFIIPSDYGFDTVYVTLIYINPIFEIDETFIINSGESYTFPDGTVQNNITHQVVYTSNLQTVFGCDSIIITTLNVSDCDQVYNHSESVSICERSNYTFPDGSIRYNITETIVHTSNFVAVNGCDSIIETTLSIIPIALPDFSYECDSVKVFFTNTSANSNNYFWDFGDGGFSFLNNPIHVYPKLGTYNVRLKALNNCGSVSLYDTIEVIYIPTGMADIDSSNIVIYPNPANENIRIDYDKELFVEFFNLSGTKVLESTENSINISELTKGTYIVLIKNREKKLIQKAKIIKE